MGKVNYAAIDIGSNAVRLLIKSIDREAVQELSLIHISEPTRPY